MTYTINSRHYDGTIRKSWTCDLIEQTDTLLVFCGVFGFDVDHAELGRIETGTISYEYYWLDRWYNVFRFHHPDGRFQNYYCNINLPPSLTGNVLDYVDLEIDIIADDEGNYRILDEDEFCINAERHSFPSEVRANVGKSVEELITRIEKAQFPFDFAGTNRPSTRDLN